MGRKVAVAIGVRKAGRLPSLPGTLTGVEEFASWAKWQGYEVACHTDADGPLTTEALRDATKDINRNGDIDRLLLYFAGHGVGRAADDEYWLLSGWQDDPNEAINTRTTFAALRKLAIPQVAVFADACRSPDAQASDLSGATLFASSGERRNVEWDLYYAVMPGQSAQEVGAQGEGAAYGVFSAVLVDALSGRVADCVRSQPPRAVTSRTLAKALPQAVELASGQVPGGRVQLPEVACGWIDPEEHADLTVGRAPPRLSPRLWDPPVGPRRFGISAGPPPRRREAEARVEAQRRASERDAAELRKSVDDLAGRWTFETRTGLTVSGARVVAVAPAGRLDLFEENGAQQIRAHDDQPASVAVQLDDGRWLATALIPQFVGSVLVTGQGVMSVAYKAALGGRFEHASGHDPRSPEYAEPINAAIVRMQTAPSGPEALDALAQDLRRDKHQNPTLGVLAAYAYERAGNAEQVADIAWWFAKEAQPIPFDVALLADMAFARGPDGALTASLKGLREIRPTPVAGGFPIMGEGWAWLDAERPGLAPELIDVRRGLQAAPFTTLDADAGKRLAELIEGGKL